MKPPKTAIESANVDCEALLRAKAALLHGEWIPWIEAHLVCSARTCQVYMRIVRHRDRLPNAQAAAHLTVAALLQILSTPKVRHPSSSEPTPVVPPIPPRLRRVRREMTVGASETLGARWACQARFSMAG